MPTFWVLKNGERQTGVTVFFVDEDIDTGPIIVQKEIPINTRSQFELIKITKKMGMDAIIESLNLLIKNPNVRLTENQAQKGSYYPFPTKKDVKNFLRNGNKF
jgi:methionyl-tRNA formyltransferase